MYPFERKQKILELVNLKNSVSVTELSKMLYISTATIRRDLEELAVEHQLIRTHGGAVKLFSGNTEVPYVLRENEQKLSKEYIATIAADFIKDGETIFLDSSSTAYALSKLIKGKKQLIVITNSIKTAQDLSINGIKTYLTGGLLNGSTMSFNDMLSISFVDSFRADKFFFSCRCIDLQNGIFESSVESSQLKKMMINKSKNKFLLADSTKFSTSAFVKLCDFNKIDFFITEKKPTEEQKNYLESQKVKILY